MAGPIAPGTRTGDLRRSRDIGWVKTRLMHLLRAAALHVMRVAAWLAESPRADTALGVCGARRSLTAADWTAGVPATSCQETNYSSERVFAFFPLCRA
jgi:hypothetical protein